MASPTGSSGDIHHTDGLPFHDTQGWRWSMALLARRVATDIAPRTALPYAPPMTIRFQIRTDYDSLQQFLTATTEKAVWKSAIRAGNTSLTRSRTEASRRVRAERKLKARSVNEKLNIVKASSAGRSGKTAGAMWRLRAAGAPVPLFHYGARRTNRGVSVNVSGRRKIVEGAFIARMPSGHIGVFSRRHENRYLPIDELFSSRVSDVFLNTGFIPRVQDFFQERFSEEWRRLIPVEIDKAKQRALRRSRSR